MRRQQQFKVNPSGLTNGATFEGSPAINAALIATAQKVEHYEMATYGCLHEWANLLEFDKGIDGYLLCVGLGVLAYNLNQIGKGPD